MGALIEKYELVKEVKCYFDGIDNAIVGKIYKVITGPKAKFTYEVDHYCRLADEGMPYIPGGPFGDTVAEIEIKLNAYLKRFETAVDVVPK
jgi:hypothetical protein